MFLFPNVSFWRPSRPWSNCEKTGAVVVSLKVKFSFVLVRKTRPPHQWTTGWCLFFCLFYVFCLIFTTRCHASAVYAVVVYLSVCPSVTSRCSTETVKRRSRKQRHMISQGLQTQTGSPPSEAPNADGVG